MCSAKTNKNCVTVPIPLHVCMSGSCSK
uniref:Uncharacterized protein n=1 Tax=Anguilla anguilla TaxID=7936 RepID=A0A0E9PJ36_ANGAN